MLVDALLFFNEAVAEAVLPVVAVVGRCALLRHELDAGDQEPLDQREHYPNGGAGRDDNLGRRCREQRHSAWYLVARVDVRRERERDGEGFWCDLCSLLRCTKYEKTSTADVLSTRD